jgi:hypothetical protein
MSVACSLCLRLSLVSSRVAPMLTSDVPLAPMLTRTSVSDFGECAECNPLRGWTVAMSSICMLGTFAVAWHYKQRWGSYADKVVVMPYIKIIVSFFTVAATIDTNYGVIWPSNFAKVHTLHTSYSHYTYHTHTTHIILTLCSQ